MFPIVKESINPEFLFPKKLCSLKTEKFKLYCTKRNNFVCCILLNNFTQNFKMTQEKLEFYFLNNEKQIT